ncbi:MAG: glycosyltransferase family 9 protein [Gemmatimonadota bacterium]|nr:glycosyltransferase family 9 protein [Gemmatimonadota bacterium]
MPLALPPAPRILIVMMSALGDAVHVLPVIAALKRHDPAARITWVLQPAPAALVGEHPDVDEVVLFRRSRGWRAFAEVRRALEGRRFDLVLDLQVYFKASVVTALARAPVKLGFDRGRARDLNWLATTHRIPPHAPQHVQDQYLEFLRELGVDPEPLAWKLGARPEERAPADALLSELAGPAVALVVGTTRAEKEWPAERWAELADRLAAEEGLRPVLVGGRSPREVETEARMRSLCRTELVSTLGWGFREMVGLLEGVALTVSVDTGPMHVSVAVGTPVIALMGSTNPRRTGPYLFRELTVDAYGEPGEEYPISMQRRSGRMERITTEQVMEKVALWRTLYGGAP